MSGPAAPRRIGLMDKVRAPIGHATITETRESTRTRMGRAGGVFPIAASPAPPTDQVLYLKSGRAFRASLVLLGRTIFLSTIFRAVNGTTTCFVPIPRNPLTDRTARGCLAARSYDQIVDGAQQSHWLRSRPCCRQLSTSGSPWPRSVDRPSSTSRSEGRLASMRVPTA